MPATGFTTLDFGAAPGGNVATIAVTGQASIVSGSIAEAFMMGDSTVHHNADEHALVPLKLSCSAVVAATGFTITAVSDWRLTGTFKVRWVWV